VSYSYLISPRFPLTSTRFLLVQPFLDSIIGERSRGHIEDALNTLMESPDKLSTVYQGALNRIGGQKPGDRKLAHRMLSWVVQSKRPLTRREFLHALAVKAGNLNFKRDYIIHDLDGAVALCAGLVVINQKSDTVQLMHHTARAYFEDPEHRPEWMGDAEEMIASACVTYVSYTVFEDGPCESDDEFDERLFDFPFLTYAAQHWGNHARDAGAQTTTMEDLALEFLRDEAKLASANQAMQVTDRRYRGYSSRYDEGMTGLHMVASFGLANLTRHLLSDKGHVDVRDEEGRTALHKAAENGHNDVVLALLENGADPDAQEEAFNQTPLHLAALNGHKAVVQTLLDHEASANTRDGDGWMAIHVAAWTGNEEVMKALLDRTNVNATTGDGLTALHCAAAQGHLNIAHLLIRAGADVNAKDNDDWTPLHWAAKKRHDVMQPRMLSFKDESSTLLRQFHEFRDELNQLVLHEGLATVKKTLDFWQNKLAWLPAGIQLNIEGGAGYGEIMAALQMTSNMQNLVLPWPIWGDIWGGMWDNVADDKKDKRGDEKDKPLAPTRFIFAIQDELTAMHCSTECGHEAVARLLINSGAGIEKRGRAGIEIQWIWTPKVYMTALQLAAFSGHEAMVRLLLKQGANIHRRSDAYERRGPVSSPWARFTALHCGVISSSEEVVQLLLDHGADIQERCPFGFLNVYCEVTPLHVAVMLGHLNQVQVLLANGADVDALAVADAASTLEMLEKRHETGELNGEDETLPARTTVTSLHLSALLGRDDVMAALLENGAAVNGQVSIWIGTAEFSLSALHIAAMRRRDSTVQLLLDYKADPGQRMSVTNELEDVHTRVEMSTLHFVSFFRAGPIPEILLEAGADVNESLELDVDGWRTLPPRGEKREREGSDRDDDHDAESGKHNDKDLWDRILARTAKNFTALVGDELSEFPILGAIVQGDDEEPDDVVYHLHARLTALSLAALRKNDEVVELFVGKGVAVNAASYVSVNEVSISFVALHLACLNASKDVAKALLESGADIHAFMTIEFDEILQIRLSALHLAAVSGNEELVRLLLDNGSEVDEKCLVNGDPENTLTALHLAALWGRYEVARVLLECGADTTQMCRLKLDSGLDIEMTVVHLAALSGNMVLVDHLLTTDCDACVPAKLDCYKLRAEFTILHLVALWGEESIVDELLRNGQDVHAKCLVELEPRLRIDLPVVHLASFAGSVEVLSKLIEVGADPRQRVLVHGDEIRTELTVLHVAAIARQREVVEFLLDAPEVDIHARIEADIYGMHVSFTLLHLAALWRVRLATLFLSKGFDPNARFLVEGEETHTEFSALHLAVILRKKRLLLSLLDSGADADARVQIITDDVNVELTALHLAVVCRSTDMVQMLTSTDPLAREENSWLDADSDASKSDTSSGYASSSSRRSRSRSYISSGYFSTSRSRSTSRTRGEFRRRSRSPLAARPRPTRRGRSLLRRRSRVRSLDRAPSETPATVIPRAKSPEDQVSRLQAMAEKLMADRPRTGISKIPYASTVGGVAGAMAMLMGLKQRRQAQGRADTRSRRARSLSTVYPRRVARDGQPLTTQPPTTEPSSRTSIADTDALLLLNVGDVRIQLTSLHIAAALFRKPSMMQLLLKNTTDHNPILKVERAGGDFLELTPLHLAVIRKSKESVQCLIGAGADVESLVRLQAFKFHAEVSSLQISAGMPPHWQTAQFLLGHRASAEAKHPFGFRRSFQTDVTFVLLLALANKNQIGGLAEKGVALRTKAPASIQLWFHSNVSAAEMTLGQRDEEMKTLFSHYVEDPEFLSRKYEPWLRKSAFLMVSAMAKEKVLDIALTGITDIDGAMTVNIRVRADAIFPIPLQANVDVAVDIDLEATMSGLHVAAGLGNVSVASLLLHRGASVENRCTITAGDILRAEMSVLHMAALWQRDGMIQALLVKGAKVDSLAHIYMDRTVPAKVLVPHLTAMLGHERISRFLARGDDNNINITIQAELAPMHVTALTGDTVSTVALLEHPEKSVEAICTIRLQAKTTSSHAEVDVQGHFTPLHLAVWAGHTHLVETMLKKGAHIETPIRVGGTASFERGARVTRKIQVSGTALHLAAGLGKEDIVRVLIDNGAQIDAKSQDGRTAQEWAEDRGHEGVVQILAQAGDGKAERRRFREKWHDIFAKAGPNGPSDEDGQSLERVDTGSESLSQVKAYRQEGLGNVFTRWIAQKVKEKQDKLGKLKPDEDSGHYVDEEID
jgi:ankyrin repeat protein